MAHITSFFRCQPFWIIQILRATAAGEEWLNTLTKGHWIDGDRHGIISKQLEIHQNRLSSTSLRLHPLFTYSPISLTTSLPFSLFSSAGRRCFKSGDSTGWQYERAPRSLLSSILSTILTFSHWRLIILRGSLAVIHWTLWWLLTKHQFRLMEPYCPNRGNRNRYSTVHTDLQGTPSRVPRSCEIWCNSHSDVIGRFI